MQERPGIERQHPVNAVLQFANIPRPVVIHDGVHGVGGNGVSVPGGLKEALDQKRNILLVFAQRWQRQAHDIEPVKQVFAETPRSNFALQIPMSGCNDADIHLNPLQGADRSELAFLQDPEQFHLKLKGQIAHFVEEGRSAVGEFDQPAFRFAGSREGATCVSEEFAFHQRADQRAAIDGNEVAAGRAVVEFPRRDFFAGSAFALDQDRSAAGAESFELAAKLNDALRAPQ